MSKLINDPRLTAYALGELPKTEIKEFEMELQDDQKAQREVEQIKKTANLLKGGLSEEKSERLDASQREEIYGKGPKESFWSKNWKLVSGLSTATAALVLVGLNVTSILDQQLTQKKNAMQEVAKSFDAKKEATTAKAAGDKLERVGYKDADLNQEPGKTVVSEKIAASPKRPNSFMRGKKNKAKMDNFSLGKRRALKKVSRVMEAEEVAISNMPVPSAAGMGGAQGLVESKVARSLLISPPVEPPVPALYDQKSSTEQYDKLTVNPFKEVGNEPLSTFSVDVDTASYSNMRRFLNQGTLPPADSVRIEELINYFSYDYKIPGKSEAPFSVNLEIAKSPWKKGHKLVRIGLKGFEVAAHERPASNIVFLLDVSGSMSAPNKLPLLKESMKLLLRKLDERDRVAIVVYAGASGMVLDSTSANNKVKIMAALNKLQAGGSTNAGAGIQLAYDVAKKNFIKGGVNRVILATDGDFNVGITSRGGLLEEIKKRAAGKIFLTVLGLGMGNYKDGRMEAIANKGNGSYAYIDNMNEAKKVFVNDLSGTLITIAKDVKIQVEFNPSKVSAYRLVGYENRVMAAQDFNNDKKDAGEIGAGHTVTALYEIVPVGVDYSGPGIDKLKYQKNKAKKKVPGVAGKYSNELLTVKLRYKKPEATVSTKISVPLNDSSVELSKASDDFRHAVAVASFGMMLKRDKNLGEFNFSKIRGLAQGAKGADKHGYRQEFLELMDLAQDIQKNTLK